MHTKNSIRASTGFEPIFQAYKQLLKLLLTAMIKANLTDLTVYNFRVHVGDCFADSFTFARIIDTDVLLVKKKKKTLLMPRL